MSVVVLFALRHALNSARKDARLSDDWFNLGAPSMPEHLFLAAGNSIQQYKLN
jgi:xanthine dehydrogenase/oxidase